jgi:hypothetical protein
MLFEIDLPLNVGFLKDRAKPLEHCQCVWPVEQTGRLLCWAACVEALNRRNGIPIRLAQIASGHLGCPLTECETPPGECCDQGIEPDELNAVWCKNGYHEASYQSGTIDSDALRTHLETMGPVQVAFDDRHLMLLDRWRRGWSGEVTVWLMDPQGRKRRQITERALRSGSELGKWTGTVVNLRAQLPADCKHPACSGAAEKGAGRA